MADSETPTIAGFPATQKFKVMVEHCIVWPKDARTTAALVEQLAPGQLRAKVDAGELLPVD